MKILKTTNDKLDEKVINEAVNVLARGGIVLYPTDTVYGLGANIFNNKSVRKVFEIKQRSFLKPLSILLSSVEVIPLIARISIHQRKTIDKYLPGPYTFILNKTNVVPRSVTSGSTKVGVRVPKNDIACNLANLFPITTTSANISDDEILDNPQDILEQLNCDVDLVIDVGPIKSNHSSTIVDLTSKEPIFIRR